MNVAEKSADTPIDERRSQRIGDIAQCVGPIFAIVRKPRVGGSADIAGGEVSEQRVLARPAVAVTFIASRLAAEQIAREAEKAELGHRAQFPDGLDFSS